ncbi:MAG: DUF4129 domain-containing protein [Prevotella sp.]|nr:DUF4129 domain-containing protein [Prevotella sp.]
MWQQDGRYDYNRELMGGGESLLEWLQRVVMGWFDELFSAAVHDERVQWLLAALGVVIVVAVGWFVWRKRQLKLNYGHRNNTLDYELEGETIYGMDFTQLIQEALTREDYAQVVRLVYLQTLKMLSDATRINWQASKTPTQYVAEVGQKDFTELSHLFMRVRYGNFTATKQLAERMDILQENVGRWLNQPTEGGEEA